MKTSNILYLKSKITFSICLLLIYNSFAQQNCEDAEFNLPQKEINAFKNFNYNQPAGVDKVNNYLLSKISELMYTERLDFELRKLKNPTSFPSSSFRSSQLNSSSNRTFECDFSKRFSHWFYDINKKPIKPSSIDLKDKIILANVEDRPGTVINSKNIQKKVELRSPSNKNSNLNLKNPAVKTTVNEKSALEKFIEDSTAYEKSKPKFKFLNKTQDFVNIGGELVIPGFNPELMVISMETYIIIAWRGTDDVYNDDMWEWIGTDAYFIPVNGDGPLSGTKMHAGMWHSFKLVRQALMSTLDRFEAKTKNKKIFITGHSLGGGMAMISAPYLKGNGYNIAEVYTYASPRVIGNQSFVDKCNSLLGSNKIQRFEYGVDFVTKLWSPAVYSTQYKIPGNRHWLNQNGTDDDYNCAERTFPLTLNPLEYMDYSKSHIDKLNGDIGSITPISLISYLASTLDNPAAQRPREAHGYSLIDAGQHNPQYYVKKAFENMTTTQKSILPAFVDSFPYVYPSVVGNK